LTIPVTILQITDLHLLGGDGERLLGVDTFDSLRAVLEQALGEQRPDALLVTGDLTQNGEPAAYARVDTLLRERFDGPRLVLPGNHDLTAGIAPYLQTPAALDLGGWTVVGMDSHKDNEVGASVDATDVAAVKAACLRATERGRPVLLAAHHPPVCVGCPWLDRDRIQNADELLEWLSEHTTVAAMVFGHIHQAYDGRQHGVVLLGTPSTCFQFQPESASFALDDRMPGYRWITLQGNGTVESEVRRVDDYPLRLERPTRQPV
jgi:Icc protein